MKTATALTVAAIGAIFAFAVTAQPSFFNFHVAGWVLILTGVAGAFLPRRSYGWLRRRLVLSADGKQRNDVHLRRRRFSRLLVPGGLITEGHEVPTDPAAADDLAAGPVPKGTVSAGVPVESDVIEQFIEE